MKATLKKSEGQILIQMLFLSGLSVVILSVLTSLGLRNLETITLSYHLEQAFQIAEAGIEYYRWHLAHNPTDYTNNTGLPGPYIVPFMDKDGVAIGEFELTITPPAVGGTVVTVRSKGRLYENLAAQRTIEAKLGVSSFAKFAVVANDEMNFGPGTVAYGPIHSNGGIRFDGIAYNVVSSAVAQYNDPDHSGQDEFGVHTHVAPLDPLPPAAVPSRPDVFVAGRQFPVPAIDFDGVSADLSQIKAAAQASGKYFAASGDQGYEIILKTNDTFDVYKVKTLKSKPSGCSNEIADNDWGIWSVNTTQLVGNYPIPENGLVFFEDHVWVRGQINTARITIASAKFPENPGTRTSITINSDLMYTNYDGQDVIGLIAQNDINVGLYSEDDLKIDAALIAKSGRVGRPYYRAPSGNKDYCGPESFRQIITLYGMIATNERYGFSWTCGGVYCSGYADRIITYDPNLLYGPPPSFPLTSDQFEVVSWEEIK
jgi:hypothetical protein